VAVCLLLLSSFCLPSISLILVQGGFAALASSNALLQKSIDTRGLPAAVLVPNNVTLSQHLANFHTSSSSQNSNSEQNSNRTLQDLLKSVQGNPASHYVTLLRHSKWSNEEPAWRDYGMTKALHHPPGG
jgi:antitoxin component of RelBE/YafQ-DinJ toxin-antitoxin module